MIPKIIHQTWRSESLPSVFQNIYDINKEINNEFQFKLWCHTPGPPDIDEFIKKEYNDIYHIFSRCKYGVQKADIARLAILHHYGGIYIDLDILCLKSFNNLLDYNSNDIFFAMEPMEQTKKLFNNDSVLCNAFIAAPAQHPLLKEALNNIKNLHLKHGDFIYNPFNVFGADLLAQSMSGELFSSCKFINRKILFPINDPKFTDLPSSAIEAKMLLDGNYGNAYAVHYWIHSDFESKELLEKFQYDKNKNIHENIINFFRELYPSNKNLIATNS